jgi:putative resolvase
MWLLCLSDRRPGLLRLMGMARRGEVTDLAITYRERLTRFGFGYLQELFSSYGVRIHVVDDQEVEAATLNTAQYAPIIET